MMRLRCCALTGLLFGLIVVVHGVELSTEKSTPVNVYLIPQGGDPPPGTTYSLLTLPTEGGWFEDTEGNTVALNTPLPSNSLVYHPNGYEGIVVCAWKMEGPDGSVSADIIKVSKFANVEVSSGTFVVQSTTPLTIPLTSANAWGAVSFAVLSLPSLGTLLDASGEAITTPGPLGVVGAVQFLPSAGFGCQSTSFDIQGTDTETLTAGTATIAVEGDAAPMASVGSETVDASAEVDITLTASTPDGCPDPSAFTILSLPDGGELYEGATPITSTPHTFVGPTVTFRGDGAAGVTSFLFQASSGPLVSQAKSMVVEKVHACEAVSDSVVLPFEGSQVTLTSQNAQSAPDFVIQSLPASAAIHQCPLVGPCSKLTHLAEITAASLPFKLSRNRVFIRPLSTEESSFTFYVEDDRSQSPLATISLVSTATA